MLCKADLFHKIENKHPYILIQSLILIVVALLYIQNKFHILSFIYPDAQRQFFVSYANDLLAPIALLSATNLFYSFFGFQILSLKIVIGLTAIAGIVWEFISPLFISWSVFDPFDFVAYLIGGLLYWFFFNQYRKAKSSINSSTDKPL